MYTVNAAGVVNEVTLHRMIVSRFHKLQVYYIRYYTVQPGFKWNAGVYAMSTACIPSNSNTSININTSDVYIQYLKL